MAAPFAWGLIGALSGASTARLDPNVLEEGIIVHTAERMLAGEHLYRDVVLHTGPAAYELLAALFHLVGAELAAARGLLVGFQALATALLFAQVRAGHSSAVAHPAAAVLAAAPVFLFPGLSHYYYTTLAFYTAVFAAWAGSRALGSATASAVGPEAASFRPAVWAAAAGALVALIALFKQTTGVVFAAAFLPTLIALAAPGQRGSRALSASAGGAAVAVAALGVYALRGDLRDFVYCMVELPLAMGSTFRAPYLNVWPPGELSPAVRESWVMYLPSLYYLKYGLFTVLGRPIIAATQLLYALPFLALAASAWRALRGGLAPAAWLHGAVLVAMTLNVFPRSSWGHLVVALPPAMVQLLLLLPRNPTGDRGRRLHAALVGLALALVAGTGATALWIGAQAGPRTFGPRVPLPPVSRSYKQPSIPRVIAYLRSRVRPNEAIFVARQEPLIYFATGTRNPTPFEGVLPGLRELQEPIILEALDDVRYAVMSDIDQPLYTYYGDELPGVQAALERHFQVPPDFPLDDYSWIVVVERGRDRGATAVDLIAERARARAWTRDGAGVVQPARAVPQRLAARQLNRPLPVALGPGGGGIDFDLSIPPGAVFQAGIGYRGLVSIDHHYLHPPGVTLVVSVRSDGSFDELASVRIDDGLRAGRRWKPLEVDLSAYANQQVTLRLEARADDLHAPDMLTWWGSPRVAIAPVD